MDLGTNTFHLLIVEVTASGIKRLLHLEEAVKLGEGGINEGFIQPEAFKRGLQAMHNYRKVIDEHGGQQVKAIATSALRNAANGQEFIDRVKQQSDIQIELISGEQEAGFIYKGILAGGYIPKERSLILDIGGGSVEFIICDDTQIYWKRSFEIGAARMMDKFHQTDPISVDSIASLNNYLANSLVDFFIAAKEQGITCLIGSSGAFESFAQLIEEGRGNSFNLKNTTCYNFDPDALSSVLETIIRSSHKERESQKVIVDVRVDMIVVASLLTRFIIEKIAIKQVMMSTKSLKEGVLADMIGQSA